jgi:hypothetical protein
MVGTYSFSNVAASVTGYKLFFTEENLSNTAVKLPESKASLPMGWENVSTNVANAAANTANPVVITLGQLNGNVTDVQFGIRAINSTTAIPDFNITTTNTPAEGNVLTIDFDKEGDTQLFGTFLNGTQSIASGTTVAGTNSDGTMNNAAGTIIFSANGTYEFVPNLGFTGNVRIPYTVCDVNVHTACDTSYLNEFLDEQVNAAVQYYRLEMLSFDGAKSLSQVCIVRMASNELILFPNPAQTKFAVKGLKRHATAILMDITGRVLATQMMDTSNNEIDITALQDGLYHVVILQEDDTIFRSKLIKK